jgi:DNA-binding IclR family transcriptional regulator
MNLSKNEKIVLDYLRKIDKFESPTTIGMMALNKGYGTASSTVSPICKRLVEKGLVERDNHGWYRAKGASDAEKS